MSHAAWSAGGEDWVEHYANRLVALESHIRDLTLICAVLTYINGQDVGLGSWQVRVPEDVAFSVRSQLPPTPNVVMGYDDGQMIITVV